jgi:hypothetical protein
MHDEDVKRIPIASPEEMKRVRASILELRPYWVQRHPRGPYYTLGASNYWDLIGKSKEHYVSEARRLNPILWERFEPLYQRVQSGVSEAFGAPAIYDPENLPLPGFHVFLGDDMLTQVKDITHRQWFKEREDPNKFVNSIHCDTPQLIVPFGDRPVDKTRPLSFTGSVSLPEEGSGLYTWDLTLAESEKIPDAELMAMLNARGKHYNAYHVGELFVHSGLVFHQIAKLENVRAGMERITLQGHTIRRDGQWLLYW